MTQTKLSACFFTTIHTGICLIASGFNTSINMQSLNNTENQHQPHKNQVGNNSLTNEVPWQCILPTRKPTQSSAKARHLKPSHSPGSNKLHLLPNEISHKKDHKQNIAHKWLPKVIIMHFTTKHRHHTRVGGSSHPNSPGGATSPCHDVGTGRKT